MNNPEVALQRIVTGQKAMNAVKGEVETHYPQIREPHMTFHEAIARLQQERPDAPLGVTVQPGGSYYNQAVGLDYHMLDPITYSATGRRGKEMWVYVSQKNGGIICCGNKG